jgi:hypothetical protein
MANIEEGFVPEIFDDREALMRNGIDLDVFDSARALLEDGVDLDDRAAIERVIIAPGVYRQPATFQRFVDACVIAAKSMRAERWFGATPFDAEPPRKQ